MAAVAVAVLQAAVGLHQVGNVWQYGHVGYNSAAYHQAARNTLRWGTLFPAQYVTGRDAPAPEDLYTHAPLALHLHTVASVGLLGDTREAVRLVPLVHGIGAAVALLLVLVAFYGWPTALLGSAIYLLLPINTIYAHMSNHSTGFVFWTLLWIASYLRWTDARRANAPGPGIRGPGSTGWAVAFFATGIMAMQWDWPAYYVAFALALHWAADLLRRRRRWLAPGHVLRRETTLLGGFCAVVLASFGGFFALAAAHAGGLAEIAATYDARSAPVPDAHGRLFRDVLRPFFGLPLLGLSAAWWVGWVARCALPGRARARDLLPVAFAFAGAMHVLLFAQTALIHPYWPWPLNPFVAIAGARALLWIAHGAGRLFVSTSRDTRRYVAVGVAVVALFGGYHVPFSLRAFVEGRRAYGSIGYQGYDPRYLQLRFAERLREWTAPDTRVVVHPAMEARVHFDVTADRAVARGERSEPAWEAPTPAVFVGPVGATERSSRVAMAARHPYWRYGPYYMVDGRRAGPHVRIWDLQPVKASLAWRYLINPWHGPHRAVRQPEAETRLHREVLLTRRP